CDDLVQSNTVNESLTQPFNVNLSNTEPNRELQPRTPTKRSRQGFVLFVSAFCVLLHITIEDYMEGITEDMFDDDFDVVKKEEESLEVTVRKEEDEEELLGVQGGQEEPKGHVQDLPEEVLREVFAHLPADDLYRNISLVCHHWRAVVMDPQFQPWKKLYCRYRKRQNEALKEVKSILDDNQINKKDDLCLLNMLRYMSQFKHSKCVNVKDVLACVKGHQLYAQAEACIKDRIPDLVDNEGPNPWSAMALMLILADGVKDVLDLVALLQKSGCLVTAGGISEYLWAVATLLLAMRKNNINISNRWHYNIFYALHLMENAPPPAGLQLITHEQQQILNHDIQNNHVVKIMAFAGTGKTTTLVKYAQHRPQMRFLYLAFNKSVAMHAQRSFPYNVECSTIHSMAFRAIGVRYKNMRKLSNNLQVFDVAWVLPKGLGGFVNAKVVTQTLHNFWASVDQCVGPEHVPHKYKNTHGMPEYPDDHKKMAFAGAAQKLWDQMVQLKSRRERVYNMTHDGYLKLWQLSRPQLDRYDAIFSDEAQDCTPVIMGIMLSQNCGKILVGDPHQQIYTFRGAVNALHAVPHTHIYYLTQSFRFGSEIAYIGAAILDSCKKVKQILVGGNQDGKFKKLYLGNYDYYYIFANIINNSGSKSLLIKDYFIRTFCKEKMGGFRGLKGYAVASEDRELEAKLTVVEKYNKRIPELVERINDRAQKNFILGTVHKAKGLEFDTVVVTDDFMKVPCARHNLQRVGGFNADDEWNLLYVAITRAKRALYITKTISNILTFTGEYFLRSGLTSTLLSKDPSLVCSIKGCENHITADAVLSLSKLPIRYVSVFFHLHLFVF
uniref:F-box DNA helicase 1 n=1 Tax=Cyprinus carpio carpio TaxID=630221 RepID=A0A9J7XVV4_CYPCA